MKILVTIQKVLPLQTIQTKSGRILYRQTYLLDGHGEYNGKLSMFANTPPVPVAPGDYVALLSRVEGRDLQYEITAEDLTPAPKGGK